MSTLAEVIEPRATDSGGHIILTIPPRVEYLGDPQVWTRDPRLLAGETAEQRGWQQCGCNGTCGRRSCPGRRRNYKGTARVARVGCPNPALSHTQVKPRCASCVCRASACEQHCNLTGFCLEHRESTMQVLKRPAVIMKRPAGAAEVEQLGAIMKRPAAQS